MSKPLQPFDENDTAYAQNGNNLSGAQFCRQSYHERAWVEDNRGWKLAAAGHRSQMLLLELINLARLK